MTEKLNVAIIGAGQAGLSVSWYLKRAGIEHAVLEAGRMGETWRTRRWDSFCFVTPNWSIKLPGAEYAGAEPDGFLPLQEIIGHLEGWAGSFNPPVRGACEVLGLKPRGKAFELAVPGGSILANTVVVATGAYQRAHWPRGAEMIPSTLQQVLAEDYRNPDSLPSGAVLVVGSGQTGCQLAEELQEAGRPVPDFDWPEPLRLANRTELDLDRSGITSVVWTSGYRPDYGWVHVPVFDDMGFPVQADGATSVPGLYFCGVHWMRKHKSPILYGVGEDAEVVAQHIVEHRS